MRSLLEQYLALELLYEFPSVVRWLHSYLYFSRRHRFVKISPYFGFRFLGIKGDVTKSQSIGFWSLWFFIAFIINWFTQIHRKTHEQPVPIHGRAKSKECDHILVCKDDTIPSLINLAGEKHGAGQSRGLRSREQPKNELFCQSVAGR